MFKRLSFNVLAPPNSSSIKFIFCKDLRNELYELFWKKYVNRKNFESVNKSQRAKCFFCEIWVFMRNVISHDLCEMWFHMVCAKCDFALLPVRNLFFAKSVFSAKSSMRNVISHGLCKMSFCMGKKMLLFYYRKI